MADKCYGCGALADEHPIVAVMDESNIVEGTAVVKGTSSERGFVGVPVCGRCHADPAHRTSHVLKAHFFRRGGDAMVGVFKAGSADLGG